MNRKKKIERKVEKVFSALQHPERYEGSPFFEFRLKAEIGKANEPERIPALTSLAGVAAVALVLLNVAFFTHSGVNETLSRTEGIDLLLESYTLVPAVDWENYLVD